MARFDILNQHHPDQDTVVGSVSLSLPTGLKRPVRPVDQRFPELRSLAGAPNHERSGPSTVNSDRSARNPKVFDVHRPRGAAAPVHNGRVTSRWERTDAPRGRDYDARFERLASAGHDVHGEASFVMGFEPASVLDAGCGTGRVAIELHRRGVAVVGVDLDRSMLETACDKAPDIEWYRSDLSTLGLPDPDDPDLCREFDTVVTAGNVMIFLRPGTEAATVARLAAHLRPGGHLVTGFQLTAGRYGIDQYDRDCAAAGLEHVERYGTWARDPWAIDSGYAVSVHMRPAAPEPAEDAGPDPDQAGDD